MASVIDVQGRFDLIPDSVGERRYLAANPGPVDPPDYILRLALKRLLRLKSPVPPEHFQGVQRIGRKLIISGGLTNDGPPPTMKGRWGCGVTPSTQRQGSELLVVDMKLRPESGPWAAPVNLHSYRAPPDNDAVVRRVPISSALWHAGGIQAVEGIVAVPVYGDRKDYSEIRFYNFRNGRDPCELGQMQLVKNDMEAKAVGMAFYRPAGEYVLAIWDDNRLDFHRSKKKSPPTSPVRLEDGFEDEASSSIPVSKLPMGFRPAGGTYQSINLVTDRGFTVYLVATRNTSSASPVIGGENLMELFFVNWLGHDLASAPRIGRVKRRSIQCKDEQANFGGAAGIYVEDKHRMYLYSAYHFIRKRNIMRGHARRISFNEYASF